MWSFIFRHFRIRNENDPVDHMQAKFLLKSIEMLPVKDFRTGPSEGVNK